VHQPYHASSLQGDAQLCILAEDCNQPDYKKLIEALCGEHNVNLIRCVCVDGWVLCGSSSACACCEATDSVHSSLCVRLARLALARASRSVPENKQLGEWAGLCKLDSDGTARKVVGCSCAVITDYGEETEGLSILQDYLKSR
jgi:small subunit ribosomal protein S12e